jgi:hypothetical protein
VELFLDPALRFVKPRIFWRLAQKKLGFRMLMDVVPLDASLVKGSHGRRVTEPSRQPLLLCGRAVPGLPQSMDATEVNGWLKRLVLDQV